MGKRESNKENNRAAILEAAKRVFLDVGYDAVTIRDVIRQTDLAAGTFYNYYRSKEDLLRALVEQRVLKLTDELKEARRRARSLGEFVHGAYLAAFSAIVQEPVLYNLMMRNEMAVRSLYQESVVGLSTRALREDIQAAIERGIMPPLDAGYLAAAWFGAGYEMGRVLAMSPDKDPAAAAAFATRLFLGGIQSFASTGKVAALKPRVRTRQA